jgi:N-acetyl-anhydromuramyl-L-alanine amidase AmpD
MATSYVVDGATLKCSKGGTCKLKVAPGRNTFIQGKPQANVNDYTTKSIPKFNFCSIPKHHQCRLSLQGPWKSGKNDVIIEGAPALMHKSKIKCAKGGVISIQKHNQCLESDGALVLPVKTAPGKKEEAQESIPAINYYNKEQIYYSVTTNLLYKNGMPWNRRARRPGGIKAIVVHWTAAPNQKVEETRNWFIQNKNVSSNYIIGVNGEVLLVVPEEETAFANGWDKNHPENITELCKKRFFITRNGKEERNHNDWTISIEVEPIDAKGNFSTKTYTTLVRLVANKLKQYQLDVQNDLLRHYDFAKKDCPKLFYGENNPNWEKFKNAVKAAMND